MKRALLVAVLAIGVPSAVAAELVQIVHPTRLDPAGGTGERPTVVQAPSGQFVVVWRRGTRGAQSLMGRALTASGVPTGAAFVVAPAISGVPISRPSVAFTTNGDMLVTWGETRPTTHCIRGRRFRGLPRPRLVAELAITGCVPRVAAHIPRAVVAAGTSGRFGVVWERPTAGGSFDLHARFFSAANVGGIVRRVASTPSGNPRIAFGGGQYVVAWSNLRTYRVQRFTATGAKAGRVVVPPGEGPTSESSDSLAVAVDAAGGFVVAVTRFWDGLLLSFHARTGERLSTADVDPVFTPFDGRPEIDLDGAGNIALAWDEWQEEGPSEAYVSMQVLDRTGRRREWETEEGRMATLTPSVALADDGILVLVWQGQAPDSSQRGIVMEVYRWRG